MSHSTTDHQMYTLQELTGKGKGLVATRIILKGTRILSEEPIIRVPVNAADSQVVRASIRQQVNALPSHQQDNFVAMNNDFADDAASRYLGIVRSNALLFGDRLNEVGIFLQTCRINHACDSNARRTWNENIQRQTVHATRDIEQGEEITLSYIVISSNRETRQRTLQSRFAFTCSCHLCSLPPHQSQESDRSLEDLFRLEEIICRADILGTVTDQLRILGYVDQLVQLYNDQGLNNDGLPEAYMAAAEIAIVHGDLARARIFAQRAVDGWIMLEGDDSPVVLRHKEFSQDPSKYQFYGRSMTWKTAVDDVPNKADSESFENWLWKREEVRRSAKPADIIAAGFDMVPRLSEAGVDRHDWQSFMEAIKAKYKDDQLVDTKANCIVFKAGDCLLLPYEGHKFLRFSSKLSADQAELADYLDAVTTLAEITFGARIKTWVETDGEEEAYRRPTYCWKEVQESFESYEWADEPEIPTRLTQLDPEADSLSALNLQPFNIEPVSGKGKGLLARSKIGKGNCILSEEPLFTIPNSSSISLIECEAMSSMESGILAKLKALSKDQQREFLSLHNNFRSRYPFSGIVKTNVLPCGPASTTGAVYPTLCLINHSCIPNAHHSWGSKTECATVRAIRIIEAGEEITISYHNQGGSYSSRRAILKDAFGFDCKCFLCSIPAAERQISDARRLQIEILDEEIMDLVMEKPKESLANCRALLQLVEEEYKGGACTLLLRVYYDAFQICIIHGDQARASAFAEKVWRLNVVCEGEDSPETQRMKSLEESPAGHNDFGTSSRWYNPKESMPTGLNNHELEAWLWREGETE